ncbi:TPA: hypothetical protein ACN34V_004709 [Vibrio parahaemolyticus]
MKIKDKLRKTRSRARVATVFSALSILYMIVVVLKTIYIVSEGVQYFPVPQINQLLGQFIVFTYNIPKLDYVWLNAGYIQFNGVAVPLEIYSVFAVPVVVLCISLFFIGDYKAVKARYNELRAEIQREIDLRDLKKESGLSSIPENATLDIVIDGLNHNEPPWHNTGWGKVVIGVAIAAVGAAIGLK